MPAYTFTDLSPLDFELLSRDLLQRELQLTLESFKPGKDGGIDLRCLTETSKTLIVQCKHYAGSGFAQLTSDLKNKELAKVQRIRPSRYILTTSVALSPANKKVLHDLLKPYCVSESDIYGKDDLNNLLGKFPEIERQHLKLWISSTTVLESIIHSQLINTSAEEIDKIRRRSRLYVHNASLSEALKILGDHNFCIIAGIPGIGKTTLAEIILLYHLRAGYEVVRITSNIQEARQLGLGNTKRIYYYDDFLGQSSDADKFAKNEDQSLLDFFDAVRHSRLSKLVLTTREYILNQARLRYEKIARLPLKLETCIIDLQRYTRLNRAEILFNHLYFSDLSEDFKTALLAESGYLKIIDHPNYNPRLIELLTTFSNVVGLPPTDYVSFFLKHLNDPSQLWDHAFQRQLSFAAQNILITLTSLPRTVFLDDLRSAFQSFHTKRCQRYSKPTNPSDFMDGCRELEGNFLAFSKGRLKAVAAFHNPSVRDFLQSHCINQTDDMLLLIEASVFFEQLQWMAELTLQGSPELVFKSLIVAHTAEFVGSLAATINLPSCSTSTSWGFAQGEWRHHPVKTVVSPESRLQTLIEFRNRFPSIELNELLNEHSQTVIERCGNATANKEDVVSILQLITDEDLAFDARREFIDAARFLLSNNLKNIDDFHQAAQFMWLCGDFITADFTQKVISEFGDYEKNGMQEWLDGTHTEDADEIREYATTVSNVAEMFDVDVSESLQALEEVAEEKESLANFDPVEDDDRRPQTLVNEATNAEISSLFDTLLEH